MKYRITSRYGETGSVHHNPHTGIDFGMQMNTPLRSIENGVVTQIANYGNTNTGKTVFVEWENGKTAIYGHLSKISVHEGERVSAGELIGFSGSTGNSTGPHLHFGLKENGHYIDPSQYANEIQNMNSPSFFANHQLAQQTNHSFLDSFTDQAQAFQDLFESIKLNLINIINSINYSMFIQYIQNFFQLFS